MDSNEIKKYVDDISDADKEFLLIARNGVALYDVDSAKYKEMDQKGLVSVVQFTHMKATNPIPGVVVSEDGIKVLNEIDNRIWSSPTAMISTPPASLQPRGADATDAKAAAPEVNDIEIPALTVEGRPVDESGQAKTKTKAK